MDIWLLELLNIWKLEDLWLHGGKIRKGLAGSTGKMKEIKTANCFLQAPFPCKMHFSPPSLLRPIDEEKKKENWVPDKEWVFLLENKHGTF